MPKILSVVVLASVFCLPVAQAQARPRTVCGHIAKSETRLVRSQPVVYIVSERSGRIYTLQPYVGDNYNGDLNARFALLEYLSHAYLGVTCLVGSIFNDVLVADAIVDRSITTTSGRIRAANANGGRQRNGRRANERPTVTNGNERTTKATTREASASPRWNPFSVSNKMNDPNP